MLLGRLWIGNTETFGLAITSKRQVSRSSTAEDVGTTVGRIDGLVLHYDCDIAMAYSADAHASVVDLSRLDVVLHGLRKAIRKPSLLSMSALK
jgi:hypothetical protein